MDSIVLKTLNPSPSGLLCLGRDHIIEGFLASFHEMKKKFNLQDFVPNRDYKFYSIINGSGSGKTTLLKILINRMLYPNNVKDEFCHLLSLDFMNGCKDMDGRDCIPERVDCFWSSRILHRLGVSNNISEGRYLVEKLNIKLENVFEIIHLVFENQGKMGEHTLLISIDEISCLYDTNKDFFRLALDSLFGMANVLKKRHGNKLFPVLFISGLISDIEILKNFPSQVECHFLNIPPLDKKYIEEIKNVHIDHLQYGKELAKKFFNENKLANDLIYHIGIIPNFISMHFFHSLLKILLFHYQDKILNNRLTDKIIKKIIDDALKYFNNSKELSDLQLDYISECIFSVASFKEIMNRRGPHKRYFEESFNQSYIYLFPNLNDSLPKCEIYDKIESCKPYIKLSLFNDMLLKATGETAIFNTKGEYNLLYHYYCRSKIFLNLFSYFNNQVTIKDINSEFVNSVKWKKQCSDILINANYKLVLQHLKGLKKMYLHLLFRILLL